MSKITKAPLQGQKSLFSFFSKAPSAADVPKDKSEVANAPPKIVSTAEISRPQITDKVDVGTKLSIYWPNDNEWYQGVIKSYDAFKKLHTIHYDDGQIEHLSLSNEKYKIIQSDEDKTSNKRSKRVVDEDEDENVTEKKVHQPTTSKASNVTKSRTKAINDDDGEEIWNSSPSPSPSQDSKSIEDSDSDDASFIVSDDDDDDDDDEEDDDESFDDESQSSSRKRKLSRNSKSKSHNKKPAKPPIDSISKKPSQSTPSSISIVPSSVTPGAKSNPIKPQLSTPKHLNMVAMSSSTPSSQADKLTGSDEIGTEVGGVYPAGCHEHDSWPFLINRKDKKQRSPDHPEYNPRTLHVPQAVLDQQTPAMKQWFEFKQENMDTVLFFKVGKFYELFHMDADVGVKEIDLIYMKGYKGHSGFPEISYGKYSHQLVSKGFRVARIEQTETPEMLKERNARKSGKADKVVAREICAVLTKGTRTYCHFDEEFDDTYGSDSNSSLLFSIKEFTNEEKITEYGICVVDSIIGKVTMAQFQDDSQRSRLRTMISRFIPSEVLLETGKFSPETTGVLRLLAPKCLVTLLLTDEFPSDPNGVVDSLYKGQYFPSDSKSGVSGPGRWPQVLQALVAGLKDSSSSLSICALGGALWQLKRSFIDFDILSMGKFSAYVPPDIKHNDSPDTFDSEIDIIESNIPNHSNVNLENETSKYMVLDTVSLSNLEVLYTLFDKSEKGSLWGFMNRTRTPFGRRLLREWLCKPLFRIADINRRSSAIKELMESLNEEAQQSRNLMKGMVDLERLLGRVHSIGSKKRSESHPDSRAIMYETPVYNSKKIKSFGAILEGFENVLKVIQVYEKSKVVSPLLIRLVKSTSDGGRFPMKEISQLLSHFRSIFDEKQAKRDGTIKPKPGADPEYDQAKEDVAKIESEFEAYLREQKKSTGINDLKFWGTNKDRFQIEVPINLCNKVPTSWCSKSQKKTHRRYWTPFIEKKLSELVEAEERLTLAQNDSMRRIFEKFDNSREMWSSAVSCCAYLDGLLSLALVSSSPSYCWPTLLPREKDQPPVLHIHGGRHPMLEQSLLDKGDGEYISNTVILGGHAGQDKKDYLPRLLLLSGPNMGGKSTLLRQTCLITIMAQMGCMVPADQCIMTPVDRIFTRVGASDRILEGQSTFFVELAETAIILKSATQDSLCILDELGRGTATHDGTAIAHAVVDHLVRSSRCTCLFATHYHSLLDDWSIDPRIRLGHMECIVDGERTRENGEEVTFLYRLSDGGSPSSYGINVARLAQLPQEVIAMACKQSKDFEDRMNCSLLSNRDDSNFAALSRDKTLSFFSRLVSLVNSDYSLKEMVYITKELWRRFNHIQKE